MFNGIIQNLGEVVKVEKSESASNKATEEGAGGKTFFIQHGLDEDGLKIGDSIAINGVCTTVLSIAPNVFSCFASKETLAITNLAALHIQDKVNLERSLPYQGRIDGHLIYGHVDQTAKLLKITRGATDESSQFEFEIKLGREFLISKGSVAINGISLTVYELTAHSVTVMIIPHTYAHTNLHQLEEGDEVNIEFDALGKYLKQYFDQFVDKSKIAN